MESNFGVAKSLALFIIKYNRKYEKVKRERTSQSPSEILVSVQTRPVDLPLQNLTPLQYSTPQNDGAP